MKFVQTDSTGLPLAFFCEDIHGPLQIPVYGETPAATPSNPHPVAPILSYSPNPAIPAGVAAITHEQWMEMLSHPEARRWDGSAVVPYP